MIAELIQKMQELSAADGNYQYQVIAIPESEKEGDNIMACYECTYDQAREVEGMLSTNFELDTEQTLHLIAIKRIKK